MDHSKNHSFVWVALAVCAVLATPATASYVNFGGSPSDFTLLGTAWDPGTDTARSGGNPAPGGATWSVMGAGITGFPGSGCCAADLHGGASTTALSALYGSGVSESATITLTLDKWAAVSLFTNLGMVVDGGAAFGAANAASGHIGDIRIGAIFIDGAAGSNVLAHAFQPFTEAIGGPGGSIGGDTHFDNGNTWGDTPTAVAGVFDFHTVALHEFGHALGLGHSAVVGSVMEPVYAGPRRTLIADDIAGIQAIYGATAIPEPTTVLLLGIGLLGLFALKRKASA
jgi:hypothetical protein